MTKVAVHLGEERIPFSVNDDVTIVGASEKRK